MNISLQFYNKLQIKKILSFFLILIIGIVLIFEEINILEYLQIFCKLIDNDKRYFLIWFISFLICLFNFFNDTNKTNNSWKLTINTSNKLFNLIAAFPTYAIVLNSNLSLLSKILKEYFELDNNTFKIEFIDFFSLSIGTIIPIIWALLELWKMIKNIFTITKDDKDIFEPKKIDSNEPI